MKLILGPILYILSNTAANWRFSIAILVEDVDEHVFPIDIQFNSNLVTVANPYQAGAFNNYRLLRWDVTIPRQSQELRLEYTIKAAENQQVSGLSSSKTFGPVGVPGKHDELRVAFYSCNGVDNHSLLTKFCNVDPNDSKQMRAKRYQALWHRMEEVHKQYPRHLLIGGGDQIYADCILNNLPALDSKTDWSDRSQVNITQDIEEQLQLEYFQLYIKHWGQSKCSSLMSCIPSIMTWDDHDIFDGYGSYHDDIQRSALFKATFAAARQAFSFFQLGGIIGEYSSNNNHLENNVHCTRGQHFLQSLNVTENLTVILLDARSDRTQKRVLSNEQMLDLLDLFDQLTNTAASQNNIPRHLLLVSATPMVHMDFTRSARLVSWWPGAHELDDDLLDQWDVEAHHGERNHLLMRLLKFSHDANTRVTILSGDSHIGARGRVISKRPAHVRKNTGANIMHQLTSSAIIYPPPSPYEVYAMQVIGNEDRREITSGVTIELRDINTKHFFLNKRNWMSIELDPKEKRLWARWQVADTSVKPPVVIHP